MFELLIALFGGAYLFGRCSAEKVAHKATEAKTKKWIEEMQTDFDEWIGRVTNEKIEYEINRLSPEVFEKMRIKIQKEAELTEVSHEMVIMGLMAGCGKIPKYIASYGIHSRGVWDYEEKLKWAEQRRFMLWYDEALQEHGIKEPLLFVDGVHTSDVSIDSSVAHPISEGSEMIGGMYFWYPMRRYVY